jgi:hypothetical protein
MLRAKESALARPSSWAGRGVAAAALLVVTLGVSALRGPAQTGGGREAPPASEQTAARFFAGGFQSVRGFAFAGREPFDLSYIAPDAVGIVALRPAAIFGRPGMEAHARRLNKELSEFLQKFPGPKGLGLPVEDIDQILGKLHFRYDAKAPAGSRGELMASCNLIRAVKPFDWKGFLRKSCPEVVEVSHAGRVYFKAPRETFAFLGQGGCYFLPDDRTIVFDTEDNLRRVIEGKKDARPAHAWVENWQDVERGLLAIAVDNRGQRCARLSETPEPVPPLVAPLRENIQSLVLGIDGEDELVCQAFASCTTEQGSQAVAQSVQSLLVLGRAGIELQMREAKDPAKDRRAMAAYQLAKDWLERCQVKCEGTKVSLRTDAKGNFMDIIGIVVAEGL